MLNDVNTWYIFLFVGCRMTGVIFFNPIFGRSSVPALVKIGLSLGIALNVTYGLADINVADYTTIDLLLSMLREFARICNGIHHAAVLIHFPHGWRTDGPPTGVQYGADV